MNEPVATIKLISRPDGCFIIVKQYTSEEGGGGNEDAKRFFFLEPIQGCDPSAWNETNILSHDFKGLLKSTLKKTKN